MAPTPTVGADLALVESTHNSMPTLVNSGGKREQKVDRIMALTESVKQSLEKIKGNLDAHEDSSVEIEIKLAVAEHRVLHSAFLRLGRNVAKLEKMNENARTAANAAAAMVAGSPPHSPSRSEASPGNGGGSSTSSSAQASTVASMATSGEQSQGTEGWILPDC
jgi:hypothetical protein